MMDKMLCHNEPCEPPFGGKESCEFYSDGVCTAHTPLSRWYSILPLDAVQLAVSLTARAADECAAGKVIYPAQENIFRALELTSPESVKVVIVGQDPYHQPGQANGLAFSVSPGVCVPPSLRNIFKELHNDLNLPAPVSGDLTRWAEQGVLLLNTSLTVEEGRPNSHSKWGWDQFVLSVLTACTQLPQPIVFLLWGGNARAFAAGLQISSCNNKVAFCSSHPSPLGATKGNEAVPAFIGSRPFSKANRYLTSMGAEPVDWSL